MIEAIETKKIPTRAERKGDPVTRDEERVEELMPPLSVRRDESDRDREEEEAREALESIACGVEVGEGPHHREETTEETELDPNSASAALEEAARGLKATATAGDELTPLGKVAEMCVPLGPLLGSGFSVSSLEVKLW